jgi:hypothetical protein
MLSASVAIAQSTPTADQAALLNQAFNAGYSGAMMDQMYLLAHNYPEIVVADLNQRLASNASLLVPGAFLDRVADLFAFAGTQSALEALVVLKGVDARYLATIKLLLFYSRDRRNPWELCYYALSEDAATQQVALEWMAAEVTRPAYYELLSLEMLKQYGGAVTQAQLAADPLCSHFNSAILARLQVDIAALAQQQSSGSTPPDPPPLPTFNPAGGTYTGAQSVVLADTASGVVIHYTTDGSAPTASSPVYSAPIAVSGGTMINAMATAALFNNSDVVSAIYNFQAATPALSLPGGTYNTTQTVGLSDSTAGAAIHYTTDGSTPTAFSPVYGSAITLSRTTTIQALATAPGFSSSAVAGATYVLQAATPAFNPPGGTYSAGSSVTLSDATAGATIYYTTDGTTPTTASATYGTAIPVTGTTMTIKAMAAYGTFDNSAVASATYTAPPTNDAQFVSQNVPSSMATGQQVAVSVTMKNVGTTTWSTGSYKLGSQNPQDNTTWNAGRALLSAPVAPGSQVVFNFTVTAPAASATYNFQWRMVQEGVQWFGTVTPNVSVAVTPIMRRQLAANNANSMPSLTANWTQPTQAGSLLVAVISASDVAAIGAITPPAGWQLANDASFTQTRTSIYYYPNNPGGRTAETFNLTHYPDSTLDLIEYSGIMPASPLDKTGSDESSAPANGVVDSGTTQVTAQSKELVITALTTYAQISFTNPTNGFVKIDEQNVLYHLTTAVHENIVTTAGSYGHSANAGGNAQWVGLVATFKAVDCSAPPTISTQPASTAVTAGQTATLTVAAAGSIALNYQWYQGAAPSTATPVGTNSSSLTVTPAATTSYWVNVTSPCGATASSSATVSVCTPPTVVAQPSSQTVTSGSSATLNVTASGTAPFSYQWYQGASGTTTTPIGTNSNTISVTPAATTSYWVKVTNACASTPSSTAIVTICSPPAIATQPASQTVVSGSPATLSVTASGSGPFTYQWYQGTSGTTTTPVGTNSSGLTVTVSATTNYWVKMTGACGTASSNTATISVCTLPGIATQPLSQSVTAGSSATLSVTASGAGPFSYQWYQGASGTTTTPVGSNSSSFPVTPASTTSYWVKVTNSCGSSSSTTATVSVCTPPGIAAQPASQSVTAGSAATLIVTASGSGPFSYQWYQGTSGTTTTLVGTNSASFTTPALSASTSYWVRVTSSCTGTVNVNSATATIVVLTHIARRQSAASNANSMPSLTANWTQPTQGGSLLVAVLSASNNYAIGPFTAPAGWQLANDYSFSTIRTSIYYYPNNPGGRTAETFNLTNYPDSTLDIIEYTGIMAASPLDRTTIDGNWSPANGVVDTGTTQATSQSKELVITAMNTYAQTSFTNATSGFVQIDQQGVLYHLTTAVFENIVTAAGSYGQSANAGGNAPWVGLAVTFKSADTSAMLLQPSPVLYALLEKGK